MIKTQIIGDQPEVAKVGKDGDLLTALIPYPPLDVENRLRPFVGSLTVNGDGVTTELTVNGSVTPVDAFIGPPVDGDLYLTTANVLIADSGTIALNRFGGITGGLTNGIDFFVELANQRFGFAAAIKTNFDLIRISTLTEGLGSKTNAYEMANTDPSNNDGYNPVLDFTKISPLGIRLRADTLDKLGICVNDDLTSVATFNVVITGYIRLID